MFIIFIVIIIIISDIDPYARKRNDFSPPFNMSISQYFPIYHELEIGIKSKQSSLSDKDKSDKEECLFFIPISNS